MIAGANGGDTINFNIPPSDPGCDAQTGACVILLTAGPLVVNRDIIISGPGSSKLAVNGNNASAVFRLTSLVTISGLTIKGGRAATGGGISILQAEPLTLLNCEFVNKLTTAGGGGAIGGVAEAGELIKISGSSFTGNRAVGNGGAIDLSGFKIDISKSTFSGNQSGIGSQPADGGALSVADGQAVYDFPRFEGRAARLLFGGLQLASTGHFRTGQPFTVNSLYDVNLDGNLTDRLDTLSGLQVTSDRSRPLILTNADLASLRAAVGRDGQVARNASRAVNVFELNLALACIFDFAEGRSFVVRTEVYNLTNRANFGVPVRFLEAPAFGRATSTLTPARRIQFYVRYSF